MVSSGLEPIYNVLHLIFAREQQDILIAAVLLFSNSAAKFDSIDSRHHPVEDQELQ
jgi:hypothetical protein